MLAYLLIRLLTYPLGLLPYRALHALGKFLGTLAYHLLPKFRKRALSNLSLAYDLALSPEEIPQIAKRSFQTLITTLLEYPKLARETDISKIAVCDNPEEADAIMESGKGVLFFCGHQANWELLFLEGTSRMPGVAIGRPIKNQHLYNWILSIRQKFGGKIVPPKEGIKEGMRALKNGTFMGIVGDQGMPDSGFSSPFLGRLAWTSPVPAMLAYKTDTPLLVATTTYRDGKYHITYSKPLLPNKNAPKAEEVARLMKEALALYEASIKKHPHEWLWIHNRWKQQTLDQIKKPYRHDSIALISDEPLDLTPLRALYPTEEITHLSPHQLEKTYRYKLIFNLTQDPRVAKHYKKYAQNIVPIASLDEIKPLVTNA